MKTARDKIRNALLKYIQIPQSQRSGEAWFTKAMENEMRALGISENDIATMLVTIYWGLAILFPGVDRGTNNRTASIPTLARRPFG